MDSVLARYNEKGRHHHNLRHINEMCGLLMQIDKKNHIPKLIEMNLAIIYHDAIYDPRRGDNEERSAELATANLFDAGFKIATVTDVSRLVLSTKQHEPSALFDEALLSDLDLAILGAGWTRYLVYANGIRKEYDFVPSGVYSEKRQEILEGFLERPVIFQTKHFKEWDAQARSNMRREINGLKLAPLTKGIV